jgi:hypothetical protein
MAMKPRKRSPQDMAIMVDRSVIMTGMQRVEQVCYGRCLYGKIWTSCLRRRNEDAWVIKARPSFNRALAGRSLGSCEADEGRSREAEQMTQRSPPVVRAGTSTAEHLTM